MEFGGKPFATYRKTDISLGSDHGTTEDTKQAPTLVRTINQYIQYQHCLQYVNSSPDTRTPTRSQQMERWLTSQIHQAFPWEPTQQLIASNLNNWTFTTHSLQILEDHYKSRMEMALSKFQNLPKSDWETAFKVAVRWMSKRCPSHKTPYNWTSKRKLAEIIKGNHPAKTNPENNLDNLFSLPRRSLRSYPPLALMTETKATQVPSKQTPGIIKCSQKNLSPSWNIHPLINLFDDLPNLNKAHIKSLNYLKRHIGPHLHWRRMTLIMKKITSIGHPKVEQKCRNTGNLF